MPNRRHAPLPVHVFVGTEPPAELLAAAHRGECIVAHGEPPKDIERWAKAMARLADHLIDREDRCISESSTARDGAGNQREISTESQRKERAGE